VTRATLKDVAREAGVSPQTVSLVMNNRAGVGDATRDRVREVVNRLGYAPVAFAQALRGAGMRTIGVVYPGVFAGRLPTSGYIEEVLNGVCAATQEAGYHVLLHSLNLDATPQAILELHRQGRVDALVTVISDLSQPHMQALESAAFPVVSIQRPNEHVHSVRVDNRAGTRTAVEYLARRGHTRIAYLGGDRDTYAGHERFTGYLEGLTSAGLTLTDAHVHHFQSHAGVPQIESNLPYELTAALEAALGMLVQAERPTAFVCFSDLRGVGAVRAARMRGLEVPSDVAVIGFNDFSIAALLDPPLTTVHFPAYELGVTATKHAIALLEGRSVPKDQVLPLRLVVRGTA
jgi:LacI family transcriptional regulator